MKKSLLCLADNTAISMYKLPEVEKLESFHYSTMSDVRGIEFCEEEDFMFLKSCHQNFNFDFVFFFSLGLFSLITH